MIQPSHGKVGVTPGSLWLAVYKQIEKLGGTWRHHTATIVVQASIRDLPAINGTKHD